MYNSSETNLLEKNNHNYNYYWSLNYTGTYR